MNIENPERVEEDTVVAETQTVVAEKVEEAPVEETDEIIAKIVKETLAQIGYVAPAPVAAVEEAPVAAVDPRIAELATTIATLQAELEAYQAKDLLAQQAKAKELIAHAVTDGKIVEASASTWLEMAYTDFDNAVALIATIPARAFEPISLDIVASIKEPVADTNESPAIAFGKWEKTNPSASVTDWKTAFKQHFKQDYDQMAGRK